MTCITVFSTILCYGFKMYTHRLPLSFPQCCAAERLRARGDAVGGSPAEAAAAATWAAAGPRRRAVRMSGWADERGGEGDGRIYVGNLPSDVREKDLEDLFYKYGRISEIELKNRHGLVPFAFVRFEDPPRC